MKRQEHLAEVEEVAIRVRVERLKDGHYLGTSPDLPGLVAEGRSVAEAVEIAQGLPEKSWSPAWSTAIRCRAYSATSIVQIKNSACLSPYHKWDA